MEYEQRMRQLTQELDLQKREKTMTENKLVRIYHPTCEHPIHIFSY